MAVNQISEGLTLVCLLDKSILHVLELLEMKTDVNLKTCKLLCLICILNI